jgi:TM2 domain-containing membrane protein YozV
MNKPPILAAPKNLRLATTLNLVLPGAGQFYLGQRVAGIVFATLFLACLVAMIVIFLHGYIAYWNMAVGGKILEGQRLENMGRVFQSGRLLVLLAISLVIYLAAAIGLFIRSRRLSR